MVCNFEEITNYNNIPNEVTNGYKWIRTVLWKFRSVDIDPYASFFYRLDTRFFARKIKYEIK